MVTTRRRAGEGLDTAQRKGEVELHNFIIQWEQCISTFLKCIYPKGVKMLNLNLNVGQSGIRPCLREVYHN